MICGKCGKQIYSDDVKCKFCGAEIKNEEQFVLKIQSQEYLSIKDADDVLTNSQSDVTADEKVNKDEFLDNIGQTDPAAQTGEKYSDKVLRRSQATTNARAAQQRAQMQRHMQQNIHHKSAEPRTAQNKTKIKDKPTAKEKGPLAAIKIISVICAAILVCVSVISIKTDIFKTETGNKPVALIKLSKEQTAAFEEFAPGFSALFDTDFDSSKKVLDDVISLFEPTNPGGLYCSVNDAASGSAEPDPLERYSSFCTVSPESVAAVAEKLGLTSYNDIDCASCYFYDGNYYFKKADKNTEKKVVVVTDSKKLRSGDFYVTADIYPAGTQADENGSYGTQAEKTLYFELGFEGTKQTESTQPQTDNLAESSSEQSTESTQDTSSSQEESESSDETDSTDFVIKKISSTALYGSQAEKDASADGSLKYTVSRKVFEAKCSDGKVYARYVIEYPYFSDETMETASVINSIYSAVAADFDANTDSSKVDKQYKSFIKKGGTDSMLPTYTNVSVSVKYNAGGFISFLERRTVYTGLEKITAVNEAKTDFESRYGYAPESVEEQDKIYMPETTYEGYTYRISDAEFIKKDEFLGKDYLKVQSDLYNAYISQYGNGGEETVDDYSDGSDEIGKAIYESAWTIGEKDVTFYYKTPDGSVLPVTISRDEIQSGEELTTQTEQGDESESTESESGDYETDGDSESM